MKPIITEKAVMMIESNNVLTFSDALKKTKEEMKKEVEEMFSVKVKKVRSLIKNNQKYFYVQLNKEFPAIDVASKIGVM
jgi:large subunit ribosomal protein L23